MFVSMFTHGWGCMWRPEADRSLPWSQCTLHIEEESCWSACLGISFSLLRKATMPTQHNHWGSEFSSFGLCSKCFILWTIIPAHLFSPISKQLWIWLYILGWNLLASISQQSQQSTCVMELQIWTTMFLFLFTFINVYGCICAYEFNVDREQIRVLDSLELELQATVSFWLWVLWGTELWAPARATSTFHWWPIPSRPVFLFF